MAILFVSSPETILGRSGQVSVFHPDINQGDLWGTLWQHFGRTAGMFLWRGDDIVRHNPPGRPVFDLFMALPAIAGNLVSTAPASARRCINIVMGRRHAVADHFGRRCTAFPPRSGRFTGGSHISGARFVPATQLV